MTREKKSSKESIKEYAIIAAGVLLILSMVLCTRVDTQPNQDKSQENPLSVISEPGASSTDPKNSAVHENKEPGDEKNKEVEEKAGTSIPVEQLHSGIRMRVIHAPLEMYAPDEHSNSSFTEEEKEMYDVTDQTHYVVDMLRTVCGKERETLEEMKGAACLACEFVKKNVEDLLDIRKKYAECRDDSTLDCAIIDVLKEKIETYYRNTNDITRIPEGEDAEYEIEMKEIDMLYEKICKVEEENKRAFNEYEKVYMRKMKLGKNMHSSKEDTSKFYSYAVEMEKKLISTIECDLELFKTIFDRDQLLYLVRRREKRYYIEDENKTELLDEIIELHEKCRKHLYNEINRLKDMLSIQKNALYIAEEVYSAYEAYHAAACKYEQQKKLKEYSSSGSQPPLETWV
ncbi:hypothetical protein NEAUS03_2393 [Nematocida ausubeli]|nr:hypothetical protein NEAUS03_2393 [Nematocida ausubeli]